MTKVDKIIKLKKGTQRVTLTIDKKVLEDLKKYLTDEDWSKIAENAFIDKLEDSREYSLEND